MKKFFSKYKKRINNGVRGAISIFLAMILLPVMGFIGLFVDISKVELSKEVVTTSADLALNTMLSQYDRTLMDYYGLFGSCQNYEDVAKTAINYFSNSMVSTSFTTSDAEKYVNWVQKLAGNTSAGKKDMIKTKVSEASIVPDENGSLNNPALMKYEIIEFMKYRAPIDGIESLTSFLNSFMQSSNLGGFTLTSSRSSQTPKIVPLSTKTSGNIVLLDSSSEADANNFMESYDEISKLSEDLLAFNQSVTRLKSLINEYENIKVSGSTVGNDIKVSSTEFWDKFSGYLSNPESSSETQAYKDAFQKELDILEKIEKELNTLSEKRTQYQKSLDKCKKLGLSKSDFNFDKDQKTLDEFSDKKISDYKDRIARSKELFSSMKTELNNIQKNGKATVSEIKLSPNKTSSKLCYDDDKNGTSSYNITDSFSFDLSKNDSGMYSSIGNHASNASGTFNYNYTDANGNTVTASSTAGDMQSKLDEAQGDKEDVSSSIDQYDRAKNSISAALNGAATDLRDNLYTLDYVMNMFSHAAFESEGKYSVKVGQSGSNVSGTFTDLFGLGSRPAYNYSGSITDTWNKSNDKKTLTLVERCAENSTVYQKEIEYIIDGSGAYSESSAKSAEQKVYNKIWAMRLALNTPAVYQHCDSDPTLNAIAAALEFWCGIPTWVTKFVVAMPIVLTCETNLDMKTMIDYGAPVILIKNKNQLFGGFVPSVITHVFNEVSPSGFSVHYSDYLKLFFFINFYSDQSNTYGNIGRVIEANVGKVSGKKDYSFDKCIVNFRLKAVVEVAPMWSKIAGASFANDSLFSKGWRSMKVDMLRGY